MIEVSVKEELPPAPNPRPNVNPPPEINFPVSESLPANISPDAANPQAPPRLPLAKGPRRLHIFFAFDEYDKFSQPPTYFAVEINIYFFVYK